MKIAAVTMVYKDYWALGRWYAHFAGQLGPEHLYIVAHGKDAQINQICPDANVVVVPRDDLNGFDRVRADFLNRLRDALSVFYDRIIRTDADELIVLDPDVFTSYEQMFEAYRAPALYALGLDIVELEGVHWAVFNAHYSKAFYSRPGIPMWLHGVKVGPHKLRHMPLTLPRGVYLVHLKYAHAAALAEANAVRADVAAQPGKGMPGTAWKKPERTRDKFLDRVARLDEAGWATLSAEMHHLVSTNPKRDEKFGVVRPKIMPQTHRTKPPAWIF